MIVSYGQVLLLAGVLFVLGFVAITARRNLIMTLIGVEIMMNAAAIAFITTALRWRQLEGHVFVLFIIGVSAAEVTVGLALIIGAYRWKMSVDPDAFKTLKW